MRIDAITLKSFRGATTLVPLHFEKDKPLVLIFGENASGKTTIVDALDFVCNQKYGSLEDRSSTLPKKHLPSIGSTPSDVEVTLDADGQQWIGRLESIGPRTTGPADRPPLAVLRRNQVLRIINEEPKKRYEALGDLLGLPGIRRSEENLRETLKGRRVRYDEAVQAKQQADEALEQLWEAEGRPGERYLEWGRRRAADSPALLASSLLQKDTLLSLYEMVQATSVELSTTQKRYEDAKTIHREVQKELDDAERAATTGSTNLVDLLTDAQRLLAKTGDPSECPLCESTDRAKGLATRVEARLSELKHLVGVRQRAVTAQTGAERARGAFERATTTFTNAVYQLGQQAKTGKISPGLLGAVDWSVYKTFLGPAGGIAPTAAKQAERLWETLKGRGVVLRNARDDDQKVLSQLTAIKQQVATVDEKTTSAKDLETVTKTLRGLLDVVEGQRKAYVDSLLAKVSSRAQTTYARVHPGEDLGEVRFYLKPAVMGSLECDGRFEGASGVPPQAYYSDSHLDTLGICVFLALAQTAAEGRTVVVLDDVLSSADSPHAERLIQMLQDEIPNFDQIVVTTHYRPWRERFRFRGADHVQLIDLGSWSVARGIRPVRTQLKSDELKALLPPSPLDRQAVASKAGVFLEELLTLICVRYRCKVPMMLEPNHTLGDLSSAITSKLEKALRVETASPEAGSPTPSVDLGPLIRDATRWGWVRNSVGAHFSVPGLDVPDGDIRAFATACLTLAEHLVCASCGESPGRNRSGSYWECRCGVRRLHPLAIPGDSPPQTAA